MCLIVKKEEREKRLLKEVEREEKKRMLKNTSVFIYPRLELHHYLTLISFSHLIYKLG
jgi:hypothetical protein